VTGEEAPGPASIEVRVLGAASRVTLDPPAAGALGPTLGLAAHHARQPDADPEWVELRARSARPGGGGAVVLPLFALAGEEGTPLATGDSMTLLHALLADTEARAAALERSTATLRAGCVRIGGRRVVLTGWGAPGVTTVLLALGRRGHVLETDSHLLLAGGGVSAVARRFLVRRHAIEVLDWLEPALASVPWLENRSGEIVHALDPTELGMDWHAGRGPVDTVVELEGNHGGSNRLRPASGRETVRALAERARVSTSSPGASPTRWLRELCSVVEPARCLRLRVGDPDGAASLLEEEVSGPQLFWGSSGCSLLPPRRDRGRSTSLRSGDEGV
jgi:hypothetical protein